MHFQSWSEFGSFKSRPNILTLETIVKFFSFSFFIWRSNVILTELSMPRTLLPVYGENFEFNRHQGRWQLENLNQNLTTLAPFKVVQVFDNFSTTR